MPCILKEPLLSSERKTSWPWTKEADLNFYQGRDDWPMVSIITPSYNQGLFIEQTILSVLNQGYPNLEYIIIDGGSTDNTVEVIKKYEDRINYWVSEPDRGQSHAINKGIEVSTGEWFSWLNSDDILLEGALLNLFNKPLSNKEIIISDGIITDEYLNKISQKKARFLEYENLIHWGSVPNQPSVFMKKQLLEKVGRINENFHYVMDWRLWLDISSIIKKEEQLVVDGFPTSASRIWGGIKTKTNTFDIGYSEVMSTINEYSKKGLTTIDKELLLKIYIKKGMFAPSIFNYFIHNIKGLLSFRKLYFLKSLFKLKNF